jgi:hypothetical protein
VLHSDGRWAVFHEDFLKMEARLGGDDWVAAIIQNGGQPDLFRVPGESVPAAKAHHSAAQMREHGTGRFRRSLFRSANARAYRRIW